MADLPTTPDRMQEKPPTPDERYPNGVLDSPRIPIVTGLGWGSGSRTVMAVLPEGRDAAEELRAQRDYWKDRHPESYCHRCGGPNVSWSAPSPLWNAVMRGGSIDGPWQYDEIICPICFVRLAEGKADLWWVSAERVSVELETVTPSGRVWNPHARRWEEPPGFHEADEPVEHVRAAFDAGEKRTTKPPEGAQP